MSGGDLKTKRLRAVYEFELDGVPWRVEVSAGKRAFYEWFDPIQAYILRKNPPPFVIQTVVLIEMEGGTRH